MCKNHPARFWPVLSSTSGPDANRIWHVYWGYATMFGLFQKVTLAEGLVTVTLTRHVMEGREADDTKIDIPRRFLST